MATAAQITAKVSADLSQFKQGMAEARDDTSRTSSFLKSSFSEALGVMGGILAAAGIQFGLQQIVGGLKDIITTGFSFDESMQMLQARLTAITGSSGAAQGIIDWAKKFGQTVPDTTEHLDEAIVTLQGLGLNAEQIMPSLANIAAVMGVDLPTAAQAFSDAYQGRFEMLQMTLHVSKEQLVGYGLDLKNVQGTLATALENFQKAKLPDGLKDSMQTFQGQMSNITDKFQMFTGMLMKPIFDLVQQGMKAFGDWMDSHKQLISDIATAIGQGLVGALLGARDAFKWLADMAGYLWDDVKMLFEPFAGLNLNLSGLAQTILGTVGTAFKNLHDWFYTATDDAGPIWQVFSSLTDGIKGLFSGLGGAGKGFDFGGIITQLQGLGLTIAQQVLPIVQQLGGWFKSDMLPAIQSVMPAIQSFGQFIVNTLVPAFINIEGWVMKAGAALSKLLLPIFEKIEPIVVRLAGWLLNMGQQALAFLIPKIEIAVKAISQFATEMSTRLSPFISKLVQGIQIAADIISTVWNALWPGISKVLKIAWDLISGIISVGWQVITGIFKIFADLLSGNWSQLWDDIKSLLSGVWDKLKGMFSGLWGDVKGIWDQGVKDVSDAWNGLWNGLAGIASSAWDGVKGVIRNGINGVIDLINMMIGAADHVPGVNIPLLQHVSFAFGGEMPYSGMARVGDAGGPEYAFFPKGTQVVSASDAKRYMQQGSGNGGHTFNFYGVYQPQPIAQAVGLHLKKELLLHGG